MRPFYAAAQKLGESVYRIYVFHRDEEQDVKSVIDIAEGPSLETAAKALEGIGYPMERAHILTGDGEWLQPECLTAVECLEASTESMESPL